MSDRQPEHHLFHACVRHFFLSTVLGPRIPIPRAGGWSQIGCKKTTNCKVFEGGGPADTSELGCSIRPPKSGERVEWGGSLRREPGPQTLTPSLLALAQGPAADECSLAPLRVQNKKPPARGAGGAALGNSLPRAYASRPRERLDCDFKGFSSETRMPHSTAQEMRTRRCGVLVVKRTQCTGRAAGAPPLFVYQFRWILINWALPKREGVP